MKKMWAALATVATVIATLMATSACWVFIYQPKEPSCLNDIEE